MKIISYYELLGMIKEDKAPKKIKYNEKTYFYDKNFMNYSCELDDGDTLYLFEDCIEDLVLQFNYEVEILEEKKKIPEKLKDILRVDDLIPPVDENMYKIWTQTIKNQNKINEICDYLKSKGE